MNRDKMADCAGWTARIIRWRKELAVNRKTRAFTLIEVMIVIGVLVILAAIVLVGMRSITGRSRERATRLTMQNLRNMLAELETTTRLGKGPPSWGWWRTGTGRVTVLATDTPLGVPVSFWRTPFCVSDEAPPDGGVGPDALDAPGKVNSGTGAANDPDNLVRNGSRQLLNTQLAMNYILSIPANRSALQKLQSDRFFTPQWQSGSLTSPGNDRVLQTVDDAPAAEGVHYYVGNRVLHDKRVYRCTLEHDAGTAPPGGPWLEEGGTQDKTLPTVLLMDSWNNPILFVPASGLRVRKLNGESALDRTRQGQTFVIVSPEGSATAPKISPDTKGKLVRPGKPFFASAGPDGDFATGDDNIYSFEE